MTMSGPTLLFDPTPLEPYLQEGWLLLTPNRRLASRLRAALLARQRGAVAAQPPVLALEDWLQQLWQQLVYRGDPQAERWLLDAEQELCLWEAAVRASDAGNALLRPTAAAQQAASAFRTLVLWQQWPPSPALRSACAAGVDSRCLLEWVEAFTEDCRGRGCVTAAERDLALLKAAQAGTLTLPARLLGVGFDEMTPLHRALVALAERYAELPLPARNRSAVVVVADDLEQQVQAAARWARQQLREQPAGPFAIVVSELSQQRALVERALLDVLAPDHGLPDQPRGLPPFNLSAGLALADTPLVHTALQLLELGLPHIERETVLALLRSPFHGIADTDTEPVAALIRAVCDMQAQTLTAAQLRQLAAQVGARFPNWIFPQRLQRCADRLRRERLGSARLPLVRWAEQVAELLELLGWPGQRGLDSVEYQQQGQWRQALAEFGALDLVLPALDYAAALQQLRRSLAARPFQPQTADAPIQVLGLLEAAGLQFAGIWLCDMGDDRWPQAAAPHPLLPRDLQRRLRMPRCDAQREYDIAAKLSASLLANAEQVVVSYQREREEVPRAPSPLFQALPRCDLTDIISGDDALPPLRGSAAVLVRFAPGYAPPLAAAERARGGSALLANQAACPFRAFASHRLRAEPLAEPQRGLSAADRGNLLHRALEQLWRQLEHRPGLVALDVPQRRACAEAAATTAVAELWQELPRPLGRRLAQLEGERLTALLERWLALEAERGEFEIAALEQRREHRLGGLALTVRVDRIDRLPDGRLLVIDYKTGACSTGDWLGERPQQPQLPLYSVLLEDDAEQVAGVVFAQVRAGHGGPRLVGAGDVGLETHGVAPAADLRGEAPPGWPQLKTQWREALQRLADEFIEGRADVAPYSRASCTYCALPALCRIDHRSVADAEECA